jgi:hypothetical protein
VYLVSFRSEHWKEGELDQVITVKKKDPAHRWVITSGIVHAVDVVRTVGWSNMERRRRRIQWRSFLNIIKRWLYGIVSSGSSP